MCHEHTDRRRSCLGTKVRPPCASERFTPNARAYEAATPSGTLDDPRNVRTFLPIPHSARRKCLLLKEAELGGSFMDGAARTGLRLYGSPRLASEHPSMHGARRDALAAP